MQLDEKKLKKMISEALSELESSEPNLEESRSTAGLISHAISILQQAAASYDENQQRSMVQSALTMLSTIR
jgi:methylthioribose-1-phosphate isomerase